MFINGDYETVYDCRYGMPVCHWTDLNIHTHTHTHFFPRFLEIELEIEVITNMHASTSCINTCKRHMYYRETTQHANCCKTLSMSMATAPPTAKKLYLIIGNNCILSYIFSRSTHHHQQRHLPSAHHPTDRRRRRRQQAVTGRCQRLCHVLFIVVVVAAFLFFSSFFCSLILFLNEFAPHARDARVAVVAFLFQQTFTTAR